MLFAGIVWGCGLKETMTSKYVTASRACHVTFPRVFPIGRSILYSLYTLGVGERARVWGIILNT